MECHVLHPNPWLQSGKRYYARHPQRFIAITSTLVIATAALIIGIVIAVVYATATIQPATVQVSLTNLSLPATTDPVDKGLGATGTALTPTSAGYKVISAYLCEAIQAGTNDAIGSTALIYLNSNCFGMAANCGTSQERYIYTILLWNVN